LQQMRGRPSPVVLVDGGDIFFGVASTKAPTRAEETRAMSTARKILNAYDYMGYDVIGLGPADLQLGVSRLVQLLSSTSVPVVCANLVDKATGEPVFRPSTVITVAGVRVGVYGVILSTLNDSYRERITEEKYEILDALEVTRKLVPELRKICDYVVGLSHVNIEDNARLLEELPGIDAIVDPYSRNGTQPVWITEGEYAEWVGKRPMLRIDGQGSRVGVCEIGLPLGSDPGGRPNVYDYPLEPQILDHPDMEHIVRGTFIPRDEKRDPRQVELLADRFLGRETCGACHDKQSEFWSKTRHSSAYATLEKTQEHLKYECVECHTVGYGVAWVDPAKVAGFQDVQCESCHGVNHRHAEEPARYRMGEVHDTTCWGCHNPQIIQKAFYINDVKSTVSCPKME